MAGGDVCKEQSWTLLTALPSSATTAWCLLQMYCPYKKVSATKQKEKQRAPKLVELTSVCTNFIYSMLINSLLAIGF